MLQSGGLIAAILGAKPPKAARDEYDRFLKAVGGCLGGEAPFDEVSDSARAVWGALQRVPQPAAKVQARLSATARTKPQRCTLEAWPLPSGAIFQPPLCQMMTIKHCV